MSDNIKRYINNATDARDNNINELRRKIEKISNWFEDKGYINSEEYDSAKNRREESLKKFQDDKFLDDLVDVVKMKNLNMINDVISNAINDAQEILNSTLYSYNENQIKDLMYRLTNLSTYIEDEYDRIRYLKVLGVNNIVLMGANGSGKSSFASFMKESMSDKIIVLPAQKILYLKTGKNSGYSGTTREDYLIIQDTDFNKKNTINDNYSFDRTIDDLSGVLSKTVTLTINEYVKGTMAIRRNELTEEELEEANFEIFEKLWNKLIPSITWRLDTDNRVMFPIKSGGEYNINDLSDGEKAIIFYILSVLNAKADSYIIVDEPETYLNPATYKNMWNMLEEARPDCTFIYISHNIDFIESRYFHDLYWIRSYDGNQEWDFEKINDKAYNLPKNMLAEILGSNLPIIFCEGGENSYDYLVYSTLFDNKAIIIPVGSCLDVERYTKSYGKIDNTPDTAYGLIDRDQKLLSEIEELEAKNIFALYFNEIEMLLICEPILRAVLSSKYSEENKIESEIAEFKKNVFEKVSDNKQKILNEKRKALVDGKLARIKAEEKDSIDEVLKIIVAYLSNSKIDEEVEKLSDDIDKYCNEGSYEELLKVVSYKDLLDNANDIDSPYQQKAIKCLKENPELRKELLSKYFSDLEKKIFKEDSKDEETNNEIKS